MRCVVQREHLPFQVHGQGPRPDIFSGGSDPGWLSHWALPGSSLGTLVTTLVDRHHPDDLVTSYSQKRSTKNHSSIQVRHAHIRNSREALVIFQFILEALPLTHMHISTDQMRSGLYHARNGDLRDHIRIELTLFVIFN